ncbi:hypothetical protein DI005_20130 [Prauserella sp. PE36]|uniref:hypothetical protein n=1 Tax=Prauserella sp. PE36 TaxID=1504709 RepID=UPI000DE373C5|nr:hypothetical protein [Prauserella sp. PE36]RBM18103.1 hypothetical protein DI005_20130 [Prauserella sp. PE36]
MRQQQTRVRRVGPAPATPAEHDDCAHYIKDRMTALGIDVAVSTDRPSNAGPYEPASYMCPHRSTFWMQPTGAQITTWATEPAGQHISATTAPSAT